MINNIVCILYYIYICVLLINVYIYKFIIFRSNFVGTAFVLYDNNKKYVKKDKTEELRGELGAVLYVSNYIIIIISYILID